jgi:hypothetical protein
VNANGASIVAGRANRSCNAAFEMAAQLLQTEGEVGSGPNCTGTNQITPPNRRAEASMRAHARAARIIVIRIAAHVA